MPSKTNLQRWPVANGGVANCGDTTNPRLSYLRRRKILLATHSSGKRLAAIRSSSASARAWSRGW